MTLKEMLDVCDRFSGGEIMAVHVVNRNMRTIGKYTRNDPHSALDVATRLLDKNVIRWEIVPATPTKMTTLHVVIKEAP